MQSVSSKIWTRIAVSISCDDNHYTTSTSLTISQTILFHISLSILYLFYIHRIKYFVNYFIIFIFILISIL